MCAGLARRPAGACAARCAARVLCSALTCLTAHTLACRAKYQEEIKHLERAKTDMQIEESFLHDKFRQLKADNDRMKAEIDSYRTRLGNATEDYVSRLEACALS